LGASEPTVRAATSDDLDPIGEIYAHHVVTGVATFETAPPDREEWGRRFRAVTDALLAGCPASGIRQVIAVIVDADAGASLALHRNRGFVVVGRLTAVGFKHGRWLDTVLLQRSLS